MNILVIGSGGREHAVIKSIKKNPAVETIYCLPGNGGIAADATCVNIGAKDIEGIVKFASENAIDYANWRMHCASACRRCLNGSAVKATPT